MTDATVPARDPNRGLLAGIGQFARRAESSIVVIGIVTIVASVIWGVLTRYISQKPAAWTGEVASIAFCWVGFIGAAFIYGGDSHPFKAVGAHALYFQKPNLRVTTLVFFSSARRRFVFIVAGIRVAGITITNRQDRDGKQ